VGVAQHNRHSGEVHRKGKAQVSSYDDGAVIMRVQLLLLDGPTAQPTAEVGVCFVRDTPTLQSMRQFEALLGRGL